MSKNLDKPVAEIAAGGSTLAFVAYPDALAQIPGAPAWGMLFFAMLIMLGLDTQALPLPLSFLLLSSSRGEQLKVVLVEVVITALEDSFPHFRHGWKKTALVGGVCGLSFIVGIPFCCEVSPCPP